MRTCQFHSVLRRCVQLLPVALFLQGKNRFCFGIKQRYTSSCNAIEKYINDIYTFPLHDGFDQRRHMELWGISRSE